MLWYYALSGLGVVLLLVFGFELFWGDASRTAKEKYDGGENISYLCLGSLT